jgi:hypothetical protein
MRHSGAAARHPAGELQVMANPLSLFPCFACFVVHLLVRRRRMAGE